MTGSGTGVLASGTSAGATLQDLTINSGNPSGAGASAYGVWALNSTLTLKDSTVTAAAGNAGASGGSAPDKLTVLINDHG